MANGKPIFVGLPSGKLWLQPGSEFCTTQWGFDTGKRSWLTHPNTPISQWPQRYDTDSFYRRMYITDIEPSQDASGLILLTASYKGTKSLTAIDVAKERIVPDCDVSMFSIPALQSGNRARLVAPVPKPKVTREYLTTTQPTLNGVSQPATGTFLPALPTFSITFVPDPNEPQTVNYTTGWVLDTRTWEDVAQNVWLVREVYCYYWPLAA